MCVWLWLCFDTFEGEAVGHFHLFQQYICLFMCKKKVRVDQSSEKNIMKVEAREII